MKKQKKQKSSPLASITMTTIDLYIDSSSNDVIRRRSTLSYQAEIQEAAIAEYIARLSAGRKDLARINAQIAGLDAVLAKR